MCLATPLQIKSIKGSIATVEHDGKNFESESLYISGFSVCFFGDI